MNKRELDVYLLAAQQYRQLRRMVDGVGSSEWEVGPVGFARRIGEILDADDLSHEEIRNIGKCLVELGFLRYQPGWNRSDYYILTPKALPCSTASN